MDITVYHTRDCPRCMELEDALEDRGLDWGGDDMGDPASLTTLRTNGVFTLSAPVLQVDDKFYTVDDLWKGGKLRDLGEIGL